MGRIKVAHIITDLDIGGAETMLLKVLRNFKNEKYEHFVISLDPKRDRLRSDIEKLGVKVRVLDVTGKSPIAYLLKLSSILKEERPEIAHTYLFHADFLGRIAAKAAGVPIVISSIRNENIGGRLRELSLRMTDFCTDRVVAVSRNVADAHISRGTTRKDKIRVIYNGLELSGTQGRNPSAVRERMGIGNDIFLLLTVANLEPKKGHKFLFDAARILKEKGHRFKLLVAGSGSEKDRLQNEIINKGIENEISLLGKREDVAELLAVSDAFILSSLWEGLPNALLEAMAAGVPVIATRVGGIPEIVTDGTSGLLVEARDSGALAEAMERLMKEPDFRRHLAGNAANYSRNNFDISKTVSETENLYEEVLRAHGKD